MTLRIPTGRRLGASQWNDLIAYGPAGTPESPDMFEWAQSRMPAGWHVEGQVVTKQGYRGWGLPPVSEPVTWQALATTKEGDRVVAIGYTAALALANLVRKVASIDGSLFGLRWPR